MLFVLALPGCNKETTDQVIPVPNGDFEQWDDMSNLAIWKSNSCPACVPPYETYIVQQVTDATSGQFAARFIYNNIYRSYANNKFSISSHPDLLTCYVKSNITSSDTAIIHVDLFSGTSVADNGNFFETFSNPVYRKIEIPISQTTANVDSVQINIVGGRKENTVLFVDNLVLVKNN